jgi:4-hydroxy-4-methyl-2-oxoglutarate aldolase
MSNLTDEEIIQELRKFDTATICNVIATYPESDICLKLYDAWWGEYYTDTSLHCMYPDYDPICGYAATAWYSDEKPEYTKIDPLSLFDHLSSTLKPVILVAKQTWTSGLERLAGLFGGNMTAQYRAFGVEGVVTDGPMRDYIEIKESKVQYLATGLSSGHGPLQLRGVNIPVKVAGMGVQPGDIIHMDHCGAAKFPAIHLAKVLEYAKELIKREEKQKAVFQDPHFDFERWKANVKKTHEII